MDSPLVRFKTREPDLFREVAQAWDIDFRPMERPRGESRLLQVLDSKSQLGFAALGARVEQRGAAPRGFRTFALLARQAPDLIWCGAPVDGHTLMSFDAGGGFESSSAAGFAVHTLSIAEEHLAGAAESAELISSDRLGQGARRIQVAPKQVERLRSGFERVMRLLDQEASASVSMSARIEIEEVLTAAIVRAALGGRAMPRPVHSSTRECVLRRALEFIDAHAAEAPRMSDLCTAAGTSERTLRYAFAERFGMSPKSYLQAVRLNGVRRELVAAPGDRRIGDVANRWGFWHMGQFAADYRRIFGELPSESVAKALR